MIRQEADGYRPWERDPRLAQPSDPLPPPQADPFDLRAYDRALRDWRRPARSVRLIRVLAALVFVFLVGMIVAASLILSHRSRVVAPVRLGPAAANAVRPPSAGAHAAG